MTDWLIRIEGVNFGATLVDTNHLSVVRGASLALLAVGEAVAARLDGTEGVVGLAPVFTGASQGAWTFRHAGPATAVEAAAERAVAAVLGAKGPTGEPFPALTLVADVVPVTDGVEAALVVAEARNRARQFRSWTQPAFPFAEGAGADPLDRRRVGTVKTRLPAGEMRLSPLVADRLAFGRTARKALYRRELGAAADGILGDLTFTDSIEDVAASPPRGGLPLSTASKVAVIYLDGNGFGAVRAKVGTAAFSSALKELRRALLADLLRWYAVGATGTEGDLYAVDLSDGGRALRLETLLWGGDEAVFVVPAWLAAVVVQGLVRATAPWRIGGLPLTHAIAVAIADAKTPVRQLRGIAEGAANAVKAAGLKATTTVTFDVFESAAPPDLDDGLARHRADAYGEPDGDRLARLRALPGDRFDEALDRMARLTGASEAAPFPRSQLYGAIRAVHAAAETLAAQDGRAARAHLDAYRLRAGGEAEVDFLLSNLLPALPGPAGEADRPLALDLALIAELWDYAHPLAEPLPGFGAARHEDR